MGEAPGKSRQSQDMMTMVRGSLETVKHLLESQVPHRAEAQEHLAHLSALEQMLLDQETRLDAVTKVLEEFNFSVAHELFAPLRRISSFTREIKLRCAEKLDTEGRDCLDIILQSSLQMNEMIEALIQLSSLLHTELERATVQLSEIAASVAQELRLTAPERQVQFSVMPQVCVQGDPSLLRVALKKLLENAWRFSQGRDVARIEVGQCSIGGRRVFYVRDNGIGFDMAEADRLFHPFQRLHDVEGYSGRGLGLTVVKRIVDRHEGELWAEGAPNEGATFYFTLGAEDEGDSVTTSSSP